MGELEAVRRRDPTPWNEHLAAATAPAVTPRTDRHLDTHLEATATAIDAELKRPRTRTPSPRTPPLPSPDGRAVRALSAVETAEARYHAARALQSSAKDPAEAFDARLRLAGEITKARAELTARLKELGVTESELRRQIEASEHRYIDSARTTAGQMLDQSAARIRSEAAKYDRPETLTQLHRTLAPVRAAHQKLRTLQARDAIVNAANPAGHAPMTLDRAEAHRVHHERVHELRAEHPLLAEIPFDRLATASPEDLSLHLQEVTEARLATIADARASLDADPELLLHLDRVRAKTPHDVAVVDRAAGRSAGEARAKHLGSQARPSCSERSRVPAPPLPV